MPTPFTITAATNSVQLDASRRGETAFTVFNASGRPIRGRARLAPQNPAAAAWLSLAGEAERDFAIAGTQQYTVQINAPPESPAGNYPFRLDMVGVENPDEQYAQGPTVTFQVDEPRPEKKPFPWWIPVVVFGALILCAGLAFGGWRVYESLQEEPSPTPTATLTPTVTPTLTPSPTVSPTPTETPTPAPPTNLQATIEADGDVRFIWEDAIGEAEYEYTLSVVSGDPPLGAATLNTLPADTTSFEAGAVGCGADVTFTLTALAAGGSEIGQAQVSFSTPACSP